MDRRDFLRLSLAGSAMWLGAPFIGAAARETQEPRFLLQVVFPGGLDWSYLFDARPLEMTKRGLIQNYVNQEPAPWGPENGLKTWASPLTNPIRPYQNYFSIVNGVMMTPNFDGHLQNLNYLLAGNPFGGPFFISGLNLDKRPLDCVHTGGFGVDVPQLSDLGGTIPLDTKSVNALSAAIRSVPAIQSDDKLVGFWARRLSAIALEGPGVFSNGSRAMATALSKAPELMRLMKSVNPQLATGEDELGFLPVLAEFFRKGIAQTGLVVFSKLDTRIDVHAAEAAVKQPALYAEIAQKIASVFKFLRETPYDQGRSILDVTTVVITSEFGRTLRQVRRPIDFTGTDHNNLCNTVLIGGRGIRSGLVLGASDFQSPDETLSPAHLQIDAGKMKFIGRPFDFAASAIKEGYAPAAFSPRDYIGAASVINTVYEAFGVDRVKYWPVEKDGPAAPVLKGILKG
ncbi:MAG TPA: DUF1501 domain-containing protein [Bdellovibrionales bacterium]|nr:DUF1501 domain-containing protein [Bdellovibrionales bacterium]